ncbi:Detected protein of unknown function [Hibiscus syriacus]|uniref:Ionotropic glutamate receptor C-terminal domain-containing protein n=1 Tax=Hibiscus syriacus TaxID=106335 RepID=A0A6A3CN03_HIBSY|nr:Detected protein of unknown function [Hibiscus syriacus]
MFEWNRVVLVYEDMEFSNAIIPYLTYALENMGIQLSHKTAIPTSAQSSQILEQLEVLMTLQSTVFMVLHMSIDLASRFFAVANEAGLMSKGFAWLVTFVDTMDHVAIDLMEGVIGLRPYVPNTKALKNFRRRYKRFSMMMQTEGHELNLFGLWVSGPWLVRRLASSVERKRNRNSRFLKETNGTWLMGMLNFSYRGISGDFELVNGQIQPSVFEIFNVTRKGQRMIGYWTHDRGISKNLYPNSRHTRRTLEANESIGSKWIIGVPSKNGFKEFVNIQPLDKKVDERKPGFTIEVFKAVWESLGPSPNGYEFRTMDGTYDDLCCKVDAKEIHAAMGDISIVSSRSNCVDFTLPYLESGVAMLIKTRHDGPKDVDILEAIKLGSMAAKFILMQSYTANLSSILTINQLQATIPSVRELGRCHVGYQNLSFVKDYLISHFGFEESMLKPYGSVDDYQEALSKGSENGGVCAIYDEIPYMGIFLAQYTTGYMMVGPTYRTDGLGFALPVGSPLVANFSRAILNFTQGNDMALIKKKYFGVVSIDLDDTGSVSSSGPSLTSGALQAYLSSSQLLSYCRMTVSTVTNPPEMNNVEESHNPNQDNIDESADEATLEVHPFN